MFGLGNIVRALAVCGLPIGLLNPILLKQKTRTDVLKVLDSMFLVGFLMVAVGQYYGIPRL
jgi:hypothetical protein